MIGNVKSENGAWKFFVNGKFMLEKRQKVGVAISGGVDSSVAAFLLKQKGYDIFGLFARLWENKDNNSKHENFCCSGQAENDAEKVCRKLDIPFFVVDLKFPFKKKVVDNFLLEYNAGRTPNPCVRCNQFVKFGEFLEKAKELGADRLATGHYARIMKKNNKFGLYKAKDKKKDQSYFLYRLNQNQLKKILFPVGDLKKKKVRKIAEKNNLGTSKKKESQEVCFVPDNDLQSFFAQYLNLEPGKIKDIDSKKVLGRHKGLALYTVGQRKGIGLAGGPYFAAELDKKNNILWVTKNSDHKKLKVDKLILNDIHWIDKDQSFDIPLRATAKIRYASPEIKVLISRKDDKYLIKFKKTQWAPTPGQSIVFWKAKEVLGGEII